MVGVVLACTEQMDKTVFASRYFFTLSVNVWQAWRTMQTRPGHGDVVATDAKECTGCTCWRNVHRNVRICSN